MKYNFFKKNTTTICMLTIGVCSFIIFFFLLWVNATVCKEDQLNFINIILSSISISLGFFGALFTFVFGLKDNKILNKVMQQKRTKNQFKILNILIISIGFFIVVLCLFDLAIIFFKLNLLTVLQYFIVSLIFSLSCAFYGFLIIFMFVITHIIFKENGSNRMKTRENPTIKNKF